MKKKKKSYHHGDLRESCIQAALELIKKQGVHFSLRDVARRLNVSHGAPYKHFKSKEELIAAIATEGFSRFSEYLRGQFDGRHDENDTKAVFDQMGQAYIQFALDNPDHFLIMFSERMSDAGKYPELVEESSMAFSILIDMVNELQKEGYYKGVSPLHAALAIWSICHGFANLVINGRVTTEEFGSLEDQIKAIQSVLFEGSRV